MERYGRHARWLLRQGCHGIAVFGTTGETQCYSVGERQDALEAMIGAGLDPSRMILGIGCCARADTVALGRHALEHGVTRLLMLPPFFYKDTADEGMVRAFAEAIEGIGDDRLALYLYHFPRVSMVPVTKGVIARLLDLYPDTVKVLTDSIGYLNQTRDLVGTFNVFEVYSRADDHLLDNLQAGGSGPIAAAANRSCPASRKVVDLW